VKKILFPLAFTMAFTFMAATVPAVQAWNKYKLVRAARQKLLARQKTLRANLSSEKTVIKNSSNGTGDAFVTKSGTSGKTFVTNPGGGKTTGNTTISNSGNGSSSVSFAKNKKGAKNKN
jgi:hypothetical protein